MAEPEIPRILVVDDEPGIRRFLAFDLKNRGCSVATACDGEDGLRSAREAVFDAVLCDLTMPGLDGMEFLPAFKSLQPETEVILMSGYLDDKAKEVCMKRGAFACLYKPFDAEEMWGALSRALERTRASRRKA